jgi:tRNA pseudouridine55 synthase
VLPVETALADIPALALTGEEAARLTNGQALSLIPFLSRMPQDADPDGGLVRVMAGGKALALGRLGEGMLHPVRLLSPA